jgi:predicted nucleic acid-binding protein
MVTCPQVISEVTKNLEEKFDVPKTKVRKLIWEILKVSELVYPKGQLKIIEGNIGDNMVLEAAHIGKARYLVTGDKRHLLPLKSYKTTKIIGAAEFLDLFS